MESFPLLLWLFNLIIIADAMREEIDFKLLPDSNGANSRSNDGDPRRPFYNIGHMCNSVRKTMDYLNRGANAIEVDVTFEDEKIYLFHGYPCDCFRFCWDRQCLSDYLKFVRKATLPGHPGYRRDFVLLYFDLKLKPFSKEEKFILGMRFAEHLAQHFFNEFPVPTTIRFLVAISYSKDFDFIIGFRETLKKLEIFDSIQHLIGFDIGIDSNVERIRQIWNGLNITNVWQGEGITNCINPIIGHQLIELVKIRDGSNPYFSKVYRWTMDLTDSIRSVLQYHIDGIMTNHPERVIRILNEDSDFRSEYRLATIQDNPFVRFKIRGEDPARTSMEPIPYKSRQNKIPLLVQDFGDAFTKFFRELWQSVF